MDFSGTTILCLGDIMLDRFAYCGIERISPEAPVPVLLLQRVEAMLGGAGNVARNIAALGGKAVLVGLLGEDAAGETLAEAFQIIPHARHLHDVGADAVDHLPLRAAVIKRFISRTAAPIPVKSACATMA